MTAGCPLDGSVAGENGDDRRRAARVRLGVYHAMMGADAAARAPPASAGSHNPDVDTPQQLKTVLGAPTIMFDSPMTACSSELELFSRSLRAHSLPPPPGPPLRSSDCKNSMQGQRSCLVMRRRKGACLCPICKTAWWLPIREAASWCPICKMREQAGRQAKCRRGRRLPASGGGVRSNKQQSKEIPSPPGVCWQFRECLFLVTKMLCSQHPSSPTSRCAYAMVSQPSLGVRGRAAS